MQRPKLLAVTCGLLIAAMFCVQASAESACEPLAGVVGTDIFDFNDPASGDRIALVEKYHFSQDVETLKKGMTAPLPNDIDFVLRQIPNHYRALLAMGRWQLGNRRAMGADSRVLSADCYFRRAIAFRADDATLHTAYAIYLHQADRLNEADREYARAEQLGAQNAEVFYNHGLLLVELGRISEAQSYADKAYDLGYPLPGLREKLRKLNGAQR